MAMPLTVIRKGYSDADMQPADMNNPADGLKTTVPNPEAMPALSDTGALLHLRATVDTNALAVWANQEGARRYEAMDSDSRRYATPQSLAMDIFNTALAKQQTQNNEEAMRQQAADQDLQETVQLAAKVAAKRKTRPVRKRKATRPKPKRFSVTSATPQTDPTPEPSFEVLQIDGLGEQPATADVQVKIVFSSELTGGSQTVDFLAHWVTAVSKEVGEGFSLVNFIIDMRDQATADGRPVIPKRADKEMFVRFHVDGQDFEFSAIQSTLQHEFGVFLFVQVMAL